MPKPGDIDEDSALFAGESGMAGSSGTNSDLLYFPAVLAIIMMAWQLGCREGVLEPLLRDQYYQHVDLATAADGLSQV